MISLIGSSRYGGDQRKDNLLPSVEGVLSGLDRNELITFQKCILNKDGLILGLFSNYG